MQRSLVLILLFTFPPLKLAKFNVNNLLYEKDEEKAVFYKLCNGNNGNTSLVAPYWLLIALAQPTQKTSFVFFKMMLQQFVFGNKVPNFGILCNFGQHTIATKLLFVLWKWFITKYFYIENSHPKTNSIGLKMMSHFLLYSV